MIELSAKIESWSITGSFVISRGSKTQADVVVVEITDGPHKGHGECVPYTRYGESCDSVIDAINSLNTGFQKEFDQEKLQELLPAGAARNAVDCALWDLQAKQAGCSVASLVGISSVDAVRTAYTLSLDTPEKMYLAAKANAHYPLLKLKLAGRDDFARVKAVRKGSPCARLIIDANEGWSIETYRKLVPQLLSLGVEMIEQPLPVGEDEILKFLDRPIPICADESCHDRASLDDVIGKYDMINIKLDKAGGLTEALALKSSAQDAGLNIMVGCMLATSLSMAPALLVAQGADIVDLDGPLLLDKDRDNGLVFETEIIYPAPATFWG